MKVKTNVKAGGVSSNHNQTLVRFGLAVNTRIKAGGLNSNHSESQARFDAAARGVHMKSPGINERPSENIHAMQ